MLRLAEQNMMLYLFTIPIGLTMGGTISMLYTSRWLRQLERTNDKKISLGSGRFNYGIIGGICIGILLYCTVLIGQSETKEGLSSTWIVVFTSASIICVLLFSALFIAVFRRMNKMVEKTLQSKGRI